MKFKSHRAQMVATAVLFSVLGLAGGVWIGFKATVNAYGALGDRSVGELAFNTELLRLAQRGGIPNDSQMIGVLTSVTLGDAASVANAYSLGSAEFAGIHDPHNRQRAIEVLSKLAGSSYVEAMPDDRQTGVGKEVVRCFAEQKVAPQPDFLMCGKRIPEWFKKYGEAGLRASDEIRKQE